MISVVSIPIACFGLALLRPCMPPVLTSEIYLECKSWNHNGNSGIIFRTLGAVLFSYFGAAIVCAGTFTVTVVLTYPSQVKLILLESMNR